VSAAPAETVKSPFGARRRRAEALRIRYPFADQVLTLYVGVLDVHEDAWAAACQSRPDPEQLPHWAGERVVPAVIGATLAAGPPALAEAMRGRTAGADHDALAGWLAGAELGPVDRYVARASLAPVLEALGERAGAACARGPEGQGGRCPRCGGEPQLSCVASSGESLVSGPRTLLCARCAFGWGFSRSVCPSCGERQEARLAVHAEHWEGPVVGNGHGGDVGDAGPVFPHLRIASCSTCSQYLIEVDMARDARAVPEVDELVALPLDLFAAEQGLTKLTPNLMGF
jgi:hypothetical protein